MMRITPILFAGLLLAGCDRPAAQWSIDGQVYVTTQGGSNVELGSVHVLILPKAAADRQAKIRYYAELVKHAQAEADAARERARRIGFHASPQAELEYASRKRKEMQTAWEASHAPEDREKLERAAEREAEAAESVKRAEKELKALDAMSPRPIDLNRVWMGPWAGAVAKVTTDSHGHFHCQVPPGDYILTCVGGRGVPAETNIWFLDVPAGGGKMILNNLNQMEIANLKRLN